MNFFVQSFVDDFRLKVALPNHNFLTVAQTFLLLCQKTIKVNAGQVILFRIQSTS